MDSWHYEPTPDFDQGPLQRLKNFPRQPDLLVYAARSVAHFLIRGVLRIYHRLEVVGRDNLPKSGAFVLTANHSSHLDAVTLLAALPFHKIHRAFPAAASDYFFTNLPKLAFSAIVVNAMPFDRREHPKQSIDLCRQLLDTPDHILILFPEGTRTVDGTLSPFKAGIGFLTAGTETPVVPCYLEGAFRAWPKGSLVPAPRKLRLHIGPPLRFPEVARTKEGALEIAARIRDAVERLIPVG